MAFAPTSIEDIAGPGPWAGVRGASRRLIDIRIDERRLRGLTQLLRGIPNGVPIVVSRAINHVLAKERTQILRRLSKSIGLSQKLLRPQVKLFKSRPVTLGSRRGGIRFITQAQSAKLRGKIWIGSHRKAIKTLGGRAARKLIKQARRGGGVFEAKMPSGHTSFFVRKRDWTMRVPGPPGSGRQRHGLPIEELKTPSPADVMRQEGMDRESEERLNRELSKRLAHEVNYLLEKHAKRGR